MRVQDLPGLVGLGAGTGLQSIVFLAAIERIPLGTAVAVEFLGPLSVAAVRSRNRRGLIWLAVAAVGVVVVTQPWRGEINVSGVAFALLSGICWGAYILLTQRIGDRFAGIGGLSLTIPVAALAAAAVGVPQAIGPISAGILLDAVGLAILLPVLPFRLEMLALRRMTVTAIGTLMAIEPAVAVLLGLAVLHQTPTIVQLAGILLVVTAGVAAQGGGQRSEHDATVPVADPEVVPISEAALRQRSPPQLVGRVRLRPQQPVTAEKLIRPVEMNIRFSWMRT